MPTSWDRGTWEFTIVLSDYGGAQDLNDTQHLPRSTQPAVKDYPGHWHPPNNISSISRTYIAELIKVASSESTKQY